MTMNIGYWVGIHRKKLDAIDYNGRSVGNRLGLKEPDDRSTFERLTEVEYVDIIDSEEMKNNYLLDDTDPNKFIAKMGAEAIYDLLQRIDLDTLSYELRDRANTDGSQQRKNEALKRLQVVESFRASRTRNRPEWMVLKIVPVIPPELRALLPRDGGRCATSTVNDLY